jgi:hypothetical protein
MGTDPEIGDHATEAGPHTPIDNPGARREPGMRNTPIDPEETQEDSKFTTRTPHRTTSVAHEYLMKI